MTDPTLSAFFQENIIWFGALFALFAMLIIDIKKNAFGGFKKVGALQLPLIQRDSTFLLDISSKKEFDAGHIADSVNIPNSSFSVDNALFKAAKTDNVVVIDQNGFNAGAIAKKIRAAGYDSVYVLDGGILNWRKENFPLTSK